MTAIEDLTSSRRADGGPGVAARTGVALRLSEMRSDHLLKNSFFIMLTTATMGALGFAFWLLNARLFTPSQIGIATTLISATILIAYLSLLGFNTTFIRSLPTSKERDPEINTGLLLVFATAVVLATLYILTVPSIVPAMRFVRSSPPYLAGFVLLTAFASVNLLTDSVFIAYRAARYNFIVDGLIQGGTKVVLPFAFVGLGAYGIFAASGVAAVAGVAFSVFFMIRRFEYAPRLRVSRAVVRRVVAFSAANHVANLFNIIPILVLPLIVINVQGPAQAGYYFVAFQVANLVYAISYAISQSVLAEGCYSDVDLRQLILRSAKVLGLLTVPAMAFLTLAGHNVLLVFGGTYSRHATAALAVFGLAVPAVALNTWTTSLLRLRKQLWALIWSNVAYAAVVCGLALVWAHSGLAWVTAGWLVGNLLSGLIGGAALVVGTRNSPGVASAVSRSRKGTGSDGLEHRGIR